MADKESGPVGPLVDEELCKGCGLCVEFCPFGHLRVDEELNVAGYHPARPERVEESFGGPEDPTAAPDDPETVARHAGAPGRFDHNFAFWCVRCRYCELVCPDAAIKVPGDIGEMEGAPGRLNGPRRRERRES